MTSNLSAVQLAKALGVPRNKIKEWRDGGVIPYVDYGKVCRYDLEKVRTALKVLEKGPVTEEPAPVEE